MDRDWENGREKCRRCQALGHECSPPERASGRFTKKKSMVPIASKTHIFTDIQGNSPDMTDMSDTSTTLGTWTSSTISAYDYANFLSGDVQSDNPYDTYNKICPSYQYETCIGSSDKARKTIIRLGDYNAAREMLRRTLGRFDLIESWLGSPLSQRTAIKAYISGIERTFKIETQTAMALVAKGSEHDTELIVSALLLIVYRFGHPLDYSESANVYIDDHVLLQLSRISRRTRTIYSEADLVCASGLGMPVRYESTRAASELYIKASKVVTKVLNNTILDDLEQRNILCNQKGFPPCHVAYMHGNENAALALWDRDSVDMLGRTCLHLATYASDTQMLYRIIDHDRKAICKTTADAFGLTPLAIAACLDDSSCFSVLWQSGADRNALDFQGRNVLALAVRNGHRKIVSLILQEGNFYRSPRHELLEAVQSNDDTAIVGVLMEHYIQNPDHIDSDVLVEARRAAIRKGSASLIQVLDRGISKLTEAWAVSGMSHPDFLSFDDFSLHNSMEFDLTKDLPVMDDGEYTPVRNRSSNNSGRCGKARVAAHFADQSSLTVDPRELCVAYKVTDPDLVL